MNSMYDPKIRIRRVDISDAPDWAIELSGHRTRLSNQQKAEATRRLQDEHRWTREKVAKLFGVTPESVSRWLKLSTEEGAARERELIAGRHKSEPDPYERARYRRRRNEKIHHGGTGIRTALWDAQNGLCYLCERPLGPGLMCVIEHDHRCCPPGFTCEICRRGLACNRCNSVIAYVDDDADVLTRIAENLRTAVNGVTQRLGHAGQGA